MSKFQNIFEANKVWSEEKTKSDAEYFFKLNQSQSPEVLYIGCSDSRVPANEIMGLEPGEVFVTRNVANLVNNTDLSVAAVINYAVAHLGVKHIVVCGHYNCGGVKAAMQPQDLGILNPWLRNIRDVYRLHKDELNAIKDEAARYNRLVELNVQEQCINVLKDPAVQESIIAGSGLQVHGWVFDLSTGLINDLKIDFEKILQGIQEIYNLKEAEWHAFSK